MNKPQYKEGTWFAMPLHNGGFAAGLVARRAPRGVIILAYLFGPKYDAIPSLADLEHLQAKDAPKRIRVGYLGLNNGEWIILGRHENWRREEWPMVGFLACQGRGTSDRLVVYSDKSPTKIERYDPLPPDIAGLEPDMLYGHVSAEIMITKLLA